MLIWHFLTRGWLRFAERLGLYLLFGPLAAGVTLYSFVALTGGNSLWGLAGVLYLMYLIALPVAGLYCVCVSVAIRRAQTFTMWHVVASALVVSAVFYLPVLTLSSSSEEEIPDWIFAWAFGLVFLPTFAAGVVCWLMAPGLHRAQGAP
jgi:hypothetical protein